MDKCHVENIEIMHISIVSCDLLARIDSWTAGGSAFCSAVQCSAVQYRGLTGTAVPREGSGLILSLIVMIEISNITAGGRLFNRPGVAGAVL